MNMDEKTMPDQRQILNVSVLAGTLLLKSGAEIFRVQETMERIGKAFGAKNLHVYVLTNGIFASVDEDGCTVSSEIRHIPTAVMHMGRIAAVNDLSRQIVQGAVSIQEANEALVDIAQLPFSKPLSRILACGMGAAGFAYIFGGTWWDCAAAFLVGLVLQVFLLHAAKQNYSKIITNIMGAALAALCSFVLVTLGFGSDLNHIIIGAIVPLVPGMVLTMSIRDFANGDYLSGTIRMIDALLIGGSIAIGVGAVLKAISLLTGVMI